MADPYDDSSTDTATETPAEDKGDSAKDEGAATALLDKDFFGDKELKPGTRCEVEVDRVLDDQVQVHKVPESEYKDADEAKESSSPSADDMMD